MIKCVLLIDTILCHILNGFQFYLENYLKFTWKSLMHFNWNSLFKFIFIIGYYYNTYLIFLLANLLQ